MTASKSSLNAEFVILCLFVTAFFGVFIFFEVHFKMPPYILVLTMVAWFLQIKCIRNDIRMKNNLKPA